jgi:hypothetical protein
MGVRPARLTDIVAVRALAQEPTAHVVAPAPGAGLPAAATLTFLAAWKMFDRRYQTLVYHGEAHGFVQAIARPGRESWDVVRLSCLGADQATCDGVCAELLERVCATAAQWGALRTFARVGDEGAVRCLDGLGFRRYASEVTYVGRADLLLNDAHQPGPDLWVRAPQDAWDVLSLYTAVTPALVRHAEGRSMREWLQPQPAGPIGFLTGASREVVLGEQGELQGWLRFTPQRRRRPQAVEMLVRPDATARVPEMLHFAAQVFGLQPQCTMICKTREYDGHLSATLEAAGFEPLYEETLLVRHTVARVTERQLLVAAVRAQGLGIDISQCRYSLEPGPQRLASSTGAAQQSYDRHSRICFDR